MYQWRVSIHHLIYAPRGCAGIRIGSMSAVQTRIPRQDSRASLEFEKKGMGNMFNVPHAIRLNDSLGNEYLLKNDKSPEIVTIKNTNGEIKKFDVNDNYSLWVTMDPSFGKEDYDITWLINSKAISKEERVCIQFDESMVGEQVYISMRMFGLHRK